MNSTMKNLDEIIFGAARESSIGNHQGEVSQLLSRGQNPTAIDDEDLGFDPKDPKSSGKSLTNDIFDDIFLQYESKSKTVPKKPTAQISNTVNKKDQSLDDLFSAQKDTGLAPQPSTEYSAPSSDTRPYNQRKRTGTDWLGLFTAPENEEHASGTARSLSAGPLRNDFKSDGKKDDQGSEAHDRIMGKQSVQFGKKLGSKVSDTDGNVNVSEENLTTSNFTNTSGQVVESISKMKLEESSYDQVQRENAKARIDVELNNSVEGEFKEVQNSSRNPENSDLNTMIRSQCNAKVELIELANKIDRLENSIQSNEMCFKKEIEIMERFHKKQIEMFEQQLKNTEERLMNENESLKAHYQKRLESEICEKEKIIKANEEQITLLKNKHEKDLNQVRVSQTKDLQIIQEEHRLTIDAIRQSKLQEYAAIKDNTSYVNILQTTSSNLENLSGDLHELQQSMQSKFDTVIFEREKKVEEREKSVEEMENRLKITEEANIKDKQRLLELVSSLEIQMHASEKKAADENWDLRKKLASLESEKQSFAKEKEYFREQLERDEARLKDLKDREFTEIQQMQLSLQEERNRFIAERSQFQMEKRLYVNNANLDEERLELEAAIDSAKEAKRKADVEKDRYSKMLRHIEQQKRDLDDKMSKTNRLEEDLKTEILLHRTAIKRSEEEQQKSNLAEKYYKSKLQELQQRKAELDEKEVLLTRERLLVWQDRITVHNIKCRLGVDYHCCVAEPQSFSRQPQQQLLSQTESGNMPNNLPSSIRKNGLVYNGDSNLNNAGAQVLYPLILNSLSGPVEDILDHNIANSFRRMNSTNDIELGGWSSQMNDVLENLDNNMVLQMEPLCNRLT